jgi:hypothetical protein
MAEADRAPLRNTIKHLRIMKISFFSTNASPLRMARTVHAQVRPPLVVPIIVAIVIDKDQDKDRDNDQEPP